VKLGQSLGGWGARQRGDITAARARVQMFWSQLRQSDVMGLRGRGYRPDLRMWRRGGALATGIDIGAARSQVAGKFHGRLVVCVSD
jgi:hypothetical protein